MSVDGKVATVLDEVDSAAPCFSQKQ